MDVLRIRPFVVATDRVFRKLLGAPARLGKPTANRELCSAAAAVVAEVAVAGNGSFVIVLQFDASMVRAVAEALPDENEDDAEAQALHEFVRLMIAAAKRGGGLGDASVCMTQSNRGKPPWLVFPFECEMGRLQLAVSSVGQSPAPDVKAKGAKN